LLKINILLKNVIRVWVSPTQDSPTQGHSDTRTVRHMYSRTQGTVRHKDSRTQGTLRHKYSPTQGTVRQKNGNGNLVIIRNYLKLEDL
jgi:hypothetical protein